MSYGFFDDVNKEYVITRPDTPLPWINYLGTKDFFGIISNTAGGYAFYQDAKLRRLTRYRYNNIPMDSNGRYLYIKDGDAIWNPMWKPMNVELDEFECRHGMGYSKIKGVKNGLEVSILFFIPPDARNEIWHVEIKNRSNKIKNIRLWSFIEWCLWDAYDDMTNFQRNYSTGEVEIEGSAIFHKTEYRERRNHYAYFSTDAKISGYDTSRDAFIGVHNGLNSPQAIINGKCKNSVAHGWLPIGVHQIDYELQPEEKQSLNFVLGYAENPVDKKFNGDDSIVKNEFYAVREKFSTSEKIVKSFENHKTYWNGLLSNFSANTPDPIVNRMANIWNQYQCMVTFNMSRSASLYESGIGRGMGYRDSNQDILGITHMIPDRVRQRILDIAATQLSDGTCFHQYQPLTKKGNSDIGGGFNDDPLWLILAVASYLKESADPSILDEKIGYADIENSDETLLNHLEISIKYTLNNLGPNGLPLIGHADWNDCLNLNCFSSEPGESFQLAGHIENDRVAESLMIAGLYCKACNDMSGIMNFINNKSKSDKYLKLAQDMSNTVEKNGWDGEWFLRAFDSYGNKLGSKENEEGKIFIESQGWCILGGIGLENGKALKALNSVRELLATPNGIVLQQPAYKLYHLHLGEVSSYPPGYKENAGVFTHNNTWIQIAEAMIGRGNKAMEYYKSICPPSKEDHIDIFRSEPYVYNQMTAGKNAATPGEGKNSWLTGTAAWSFVAISNYILGIHPDYDGLIIDPCIPKEWDEYHITRKFRGAIYHINIKNPSKISKGNVAISVDGNDIKGNKIPVFDDGKEHSIIVIMS